MISLSLLAYHCNTLICMSNLLCCPFNLDVQMFRRDTINPSQLFFLFSHIFNDILYNIPLVC